MTWNGLSYVLATAIFASACTPLPTITEPLTDGGTSEPDASVSDASTDSNSGAGDSGAGDSGAGDSGAGELPASCAAVQGSSTGVYRLASGPAYCNAGWTLVLKVRAETTAWAYPSKCWTQDGPCLIASAAPTGDADALAADDAIYPAYTTVSGTQVRLRTVPSTPTMAQDAILAYSQGPRTLAAAIQNPEPAQVVLARPVGLLETGANEALGATGLSHGVGGYAQVRIGYVATQKPAMGSSYTLGWSGVGGEMGKTCGTFPAQAAGAFGLPACTDAAKAVATPAFVYVYVK